MKPSKQLAQVIAGFEKVDTKMDGILTEDLMVRLMASWMMWRRTLRTRAYSSGCELFGPNRAARTGGFRAASLSVKRS